MNTCSSIFSYEQHSPLIFSADFSNEVIGRDRPITWSKTILKNIPYGLCINGPVVVKCLVFALLLLYPFEALYAQKNAILSTKNLGGDRSEAITRDYVRTTDGGVIVSMYSNSTIGNINTGCCSANIHSERLFQKYNGNASLEWEKCYGQDSLQVLFLFPSTNNTFVVGGLTPVPGIGSHFMIRKENAAGSILWTKHYGDLNGGGQTLVCMVQTADGGFIMAGKETGYGGDIPIHYGSPLSTDIWVLKLDSNGNKLWSKIVGGTYEDAPNKVLPLADGGCYISGYTNSDDYDCTGLNNAAFTKTDIYLVKLDSNGNTKWHKCIGGSDDDGPADAVLGNNNSIYILGNTFSSNGWIHHHKGFQDVFVVHTDSSGNLLWDNCYGTASSYESSAAIDLDNTGDIWISANCSVKGGDVDTVYGNGDVFVLQTDSLGNKKSSRIMGTPFLDVPSLIMACPNNTVVVGGDYYGPCTNGTLPNLFLSTGNEPDAFLVKLANWTTGVNDVVANQSGIRVYPNPSKERCRIELAGNIERSGQVTIIDAMGRLAYGPEKMNGEVLKISTASLSRGNYHVVYTLEKGKTYTQNLILQ